MLTFDGCAPYPTPFMPLRSGLYALDFRLNELPEIGFEALVRSFLVLPHRPGVAGYVHGENGGEAARLAHSVSPAARRRPDSHNSRCSVFRRKLRSEITTGVIARSRATISRASSSRPICA